jgi:uncharacterized protein YcaQ
MPAKESLSRAQARRIALHAQGFGERRPTGRTDRRHVRRVLDRIGFLQIDSVNVLVRSQELPLFARLGDHDRSTLPKMSARGELFEFWCHEASLLPVEMRPLLLWTIEAHSERLWNILKHRTPEDLAYMEAVYEEVKERGPITAGELSDPGVKGVGMWNWSKGKRALEMLFWEGRVTARRRPADFARVYDLTERMIPTDVLHRPPLSEADGRRALIERSARHHGVGTLPDLADYHRLNATKSKTAVAELVEEGTLVPVEVEGAGRPVYLHCDAYLPRWVKARALLTPFDPVVWFRPRSEWLFDFHYRIEIYTPKPKRVYGYYVLPFLLGDRIVARVDLKADRQASTLLVQGAFAEPWADPAEIAPPLQEELGVMAQWLGLESVTVVGRGDLSPALAAVTAGAGAPRRSRSG